MSDAAKQPGSFRDKVATVDKKGKRIWIFPQKPEGRLYNYRKLATVFYLIVFFGLPFVKVNGHPLFLLNVLQRKFILFGQIFWPQDFFIFAIGMVVFIVFVALFTTVFGRVFCGWACPQTIFMEMLFRKIEYWIDGNAAQQKMLANGPWNTDKVIKRVAKWIAFWTLSFIIANTFLAYVIGVDELGKLIREPLSQNLGTFTALVLFTTVFFFVYLWMREQREASIDADGSASGRAFVESLPQLRAELLADAQYLVTTDVDDFAIEDLHAHEMCAVNPDYFMALRFSEHAYREGVRTLAEVAKNPPRSEAEVHRMLGRRHPNLVGRFADAYETSAVPADDDQPRVLVRGAVCVRCAAKLAGDEGLRLGLCTRHLP